MTRTNFLLPFEVVKSKIVHMAFQKAKLRAAFSAPNLERFALYCAQCKGDWPGCDCAETEAENITKMQAFLDRHPSNQRAAVRRAEYLSSGGNKHSITEFRAWEIQNYGNCI